MNFENWEGPIKLILYIIFGSTYSAPEPKSQVSFRHCRWGAILTLLAKKAIFTKRNIRWKGMIYKKTEAEVYKLVGRNESVQKKISRPSKHLMGFAYLWGGRHLQKR